MSHETSIEGFYDAHGNPCSLERLCQGEPGWAARRIREERAQFAELKNAVALAEQEKQALRAEVARKDAALRACVDEMFYPTENWEVVTASVRERANAALSPAASEPSKSEDVAERTVWTGSLHAKGAIAETLLGGSWEENERQAAADYNQDNEHLYRIHITATREPDAEGTVKP